MQNLRAARPKCNIYPTRHLWLHFS